jgi:hypothetical protein
VKDKIVEREMEDEKDLYIEVVEEENAIDNQQSQM